MADHALEILVLSYSLIGLIVLDVSGAIPYIPLSCFTRSPADSSGDDPNRDKKFLEIISFKDKIMSRVCELTGKAVMSGNNVSHALNRTRRKFLPNLTKTTLLSDVLGSSVKMRISTHALRSVEHNGGLDSFLVKARDMNLSVRARRLKKLIKKKISEKTA